MAQTNPKNDFTLEIESLAYGPYGIGRIDNQVIMVPATVPGDKICARVTDSKGNYAVGEKLRLLEPSPLRQAPPCPYVHDCGGCPWQQVQYAAQLKAKEQSVADALRRIGKLHGFELRPIISSPHEYHYRRRIRLQRDKAKRIGFFRAFSHDLVEVDRCLIADNGLNKVLDPLRSWMSELETTVEHVEIVSGDDVDEIVAVGKVAGEFILKDDSPCERLLNRASGINGLILRGDNWRKEWGQTVVSIRCDDGICLKVEADLFIQVNAEGNRKLLTELLAAGGFEKNDQLLELYAGAGNFTLSLAKRAQNIVAVEGYRPSVNSGNRSAQFNGIPNIRWVCAPVPAAVERLAKRRKRFSKIILDPPRAGAKGIDRDLVSFGAQKILYVSCNPATLARDLAALVRHGYHLQLVQPIDLFPHTFHVETLAVMIDRQTRLTGC
jgi:23S rRNA (uracil1939-C5)-methyltransferase